MALIPVVILLLGFIAAMVIPRVMHAPSIKSDCDNVENSTEN